MALKKPSGASGGKDRLSPAEKRRISLLGISARMRILTPARRKEIARAAIAARFAKLSPDEKHRVLSEMGKEGAKVKWAKLSQTKISDVMGKLSKARWTQISAFERSRILRKRVTQAAAKRTKEQRSAIVKKAWKKRRIKTLLKKINGLTESYNQTEETIRQIRVEGKEPSKGLINKINKLAMEISNAKMLLKFRGKTPKEQ